MCCRSDTTSLLAANLRKYLPIRSSSAPGQCYEVEVDNIILAMSKQDKAAEVKHCFEGVNFFGIKAENQFVGIEQHAFGALRVQVQGRRLVAGIAAADVVPVLGADADCDDIATWLTELEPDKAHCTWLNSPNLAHVPHNLLQAMSRNTHTHKRTE